jgi:hypothetical protein
VHLTRILPGASLTATRNERLAPARRAHAVEWGPEQSFTVEISYVPESIPTIKAG